MENKVKGKFACNTFIIIYYNVKKCTVKVNFGGKNNNCTLICQNYD